MRGPFLTMAAMVIAQAQVSLTVGLDTSRSEATVWAEAQSEAKRIIETLPDGTHATIFTLGGSVHRVFDGNINSARRSEALRQLDAARPAEMNTDLAAAMADSVASMNGLPGRHIFVLISDCKNMPERKSHYRGRSFQQVLNEVKLPAGTELFVRVTGNEPLSSSKPGISILRTLPDWRAVLRLQAPVLPPKSSPAPDFHRWLLAAAIAVALMVVLVIVLVRLRHAPNNDGAELEAAVEFPIEERLPSSDTLEGMTYTVQRAGSLEWVSLGTEDRREITIGDDPLAEIEVAGAEGVLLRLELALDDRMTLANIGRAPVRVGKKRIAPGVRQTLPPGGAQIGIGREVFEVYPEMVIKTVER